MPKEITIGDELFFISRFKEGLFKKPVNGTSGEEELVYKFSDKTILDILCHRNSMFVLTNKGYYCSYDKGKSWISSTEWDHQNNDYKKELDVNHYSNMLTSYLERNKSSVDKFTLKELLTIKTAPCLQIIELTDEMNLNRFFKTFLYLTLKIRKPLVFLYSSSKEDEIVDFLVAKMVENKKFIKRRAVNSLPEHIYPTPVSSNLELFDFYSIIEFASIFNKANIIVIPDLMTLFQEKQSADWVEACLNLLLHASTEMGLRIVVAYDKTASLEKDKMKLLNEFSERRVDRFVEEDKAGEVLYKEVEM